MSIITIIQISKYRKRIQTDPLWKAQYSEYTSCAYTAMFEIMLCQINNYTRIPKRKGVEPTLILIHQLFDRLS